MSLTIYNEDQLLVTDLGGEIVTAHNGVTGESVDVLFYLRNDDANVYYTDLELSFTDSDATDDTLGVYGSGRGFKLSVGSRQPSDTEWEDVVAGDFVELDDIGTTSAPDTTTYFPVWMRVIVPGSTKIQTFKDVKLVVTAVERLIGS